MAEFKSSSRVEGNTLFVTFEGPIDEDTSFPKVDMSSINQVNLDLNGVKSINSVGIREWLDWIRPISEKAPMTLEKCPKALVYQFNMVEGFLPARAKVASFYVPYFCEKCDNEQDFLFTVGKEVVATGGKVKINFDPKGQSTCKGAYCEMEPDVTESKYYQFLTKG